MITDVAGLNKKSLCNNRAVGSFYLFGKTFKKRPLPFFSNETRLLDNTFSNNKLPLSFDDRKNILSALSGVTRYIDKMRDRIIVRGIVPIRALSYLHH